jgi:hypothetical protein
LALLCAIGSILAVTVSPAQAATATFGYTGGEQAFLIPNGNSTVHVLVVGGSGGEGGALGGAAAEVAADLHVTPGQILYVEVGGTGQDSGEGGAGGFNGGAAGPTVTGGGGGASDLRLSPRTAGLSPDARLIVAGGGGGGGGDGEGEEGADGGDAGGLGGTSTGGNEGGGPGTQSAGGGGGFGCGGTGASGELGLGGIGAPGFTGTNGGGGGGGGFYGGGGGGGGCSSGGGGGGGGSSLVPAGGKLETALPSAAPLVQITYTPAPVTPTVAPPPATAPDTVLGSHPRKNLKTAKKRVRVKFSFSSPTAGATFRCKLDKAPFSPCASPRSYKVKAGKHKFSVKAVSGGLTDPTPAVFGFTVTRTS